MVRASRSVRAHHPYARDDGHSGLSSPNEQEAVP